MTYLEQVRGILSREVTQRERNLTMKNDHEIRIEESIEALACFLDEVELRVRVVDKRTGPFTKLYR